MAALMPLRMESLPRVGSTSRDSINMQRRAERILQDVGQFERLLLVKRAGDPPAARP